MKKILKNCRATKEYFDRLPKIYAVCKFAKYGYREFYFSGKYSKDKTVPLIWNYYDGNGIADEWHLQPVNTAGNCLFWTFSKNVAKFTVDNLNKGERIE